MKEIEELQGAREGILQRFRAREVEIKKLKVLMEELGLTARRVKDEMDQFGVDLNRQDQALRIIREK